MAIPAPRKLFRLLAEAPATYDLVLAPFAIVGLSVASYGRFWNNQPWRGGLLAGTAAITVLFSLTKAFVTVRQQLRRESIHELLGCLHVLHALMTAGDDANEPHDLRITFHVPVADGRYLE